MKYDILLGFKRYLQDNLNPNTAKTYYSAVKKVFNNCNISSMEMYRKVTYWTSLNTSGLKMR